jgi:hypothetical protein
MRGKFYSIGALVMLVASSFSVFGQGSISGVVKDAKSGETIVGANVLIQGTTIGAATDLDGNFLISNVLAGTYVLQISFVTYKTHTVQDVVVQNAKRTSLEISLAEDVSELDEVVVTATKSIDNDYSILSAIRESKLVVSGISAEMITRTPDRDAAEVVKRVPGVTIMGGRYIVIRGASERYNVTMLNGAYAPSMEADKRSFAFDVIPSGQLDQLLIFKSPSPELPGDFAGGVVKIATKNIPEENSLTFGYSLGYRTGSTFSDFYQSKRDGEQLFGFNGGLNNLPSNFPSDLRGITNEGSLSQAAKSLSNNWVPEKINSFLDQSASLTGTFKFNVKKIQVGNITAINWSNNRNRFNVTRKDYNQFDNVNNQPSLIYNYVDDQNNQNSRLGVLFNWAFRFNENHTIEFKNLANQINNSQYIARAGRNIEGNFYGKWGGFQEVFRGVYSGQLLGKHKFFDGKTTVNWVANLGKSYRDMPDNRRYRRDLNQGSGEERTYIPIRQAQVYFLGRFYGEMDENSKSVSVSIDHTLEVKDNFLPILSAGVFYDMKDRDFVARNIGFGRDAFNWNTSLEYLPIQELFNPNNIYSSTGDGLIIDEQTNGSDSYSANNKLLAYYGGVTLPFGKKLTVSGGVRVENNTQILNSATNTGDDIDQDVNVNRVLPSANVAFNINEKTLVRATYGQTLNRPEFREIAPFSFYDFEFNWVYSGTPNLRTAKIQNYDLRFEWYPSKTEMVTFGAFYKDFTDAIEAVYVPGAGSQGAKGFRYANAKSASVYGVELDIRKSLNGLTASKFLNNLNVLFNASLIRSTVDVGSQPERPLMGQSPYVVNGGAYYQNDENGLQVAVLYNVVGKRLFAVGGYTDFGEPLYEDIYEMPRGLLDLSITKTFAERIQAKLSISDILNQKYILLQDGNRDGEFDKKNDQIVQENRFGSLITLGFNYKIW